MAFSRFPIILSFTWGSLAPLSAYLSICRAAVYLYLCLPLSVRRWLIACCNNNGGGGSNSSSAEDKAQRNWAFSSDRAIPLIKVMHKCQCVYRTVKWCVYLSIYLCARPGRQENEGQWPASPPPLTIGTERSSVRCVAVTVVDGEYSDEWQIKRLGLD